MSSAHDSCSVCDGPIDTYGRDGTRCARCDAPCPVCERDLACCGHPLPDLALTETQSDPFLPTAAFDRAVRRSARG